MQIFCVGKMKLQTPEEAITRVVSIVLSGLVLFGDVIADPFAARGRRERDDPAVSWSCHGPLLTRLLRRLPDGKDHVCTGRHTGQRLPYWLMTRKTPGVNKIQRPGCANVFDKQSGSHSVCPHSCAIDHSSRHRHGEYHWRVPLLHARMSSWLPHHA
jgi:hypothetical protein